MIASQTIDQLQKLRQLIATQTQSQSNFLAAQAQIQANQTDATQTLMKQGNGTPDRTKRLYRLLTRERST